MPNKIVDLTLKRKVRQLKLHPEFKILNFDFEKILEDINFFKKHTGLIRKSDVFFSKIFKINKNYSKSVVIQQDFVEEFQKIG